MQLCLVVVIPGFIGRIETQRHREPGAAFGRQPNVASARARFFCPKSFCLDEWSRAKGRKIAGRKMRAGKQPTQKATIKVSPRETFSSLVFLLTNQDARTL
jgi:hypothetical protein